MVTPSIFPMAVRRAEHADRAVLERLAALDSQRPPAGDVLIAEIDGRPVAALGLDDGRFVADPFTHTADAAALLALRARAVRPRPARNRFIRRRHFPARSASLST